VPLRTYAVAGRRLAVHRTGTPGGPPVLLLHGLGSDHRGLADLAAAWPHADVYSPDLPGFGESAPLPAPHSLTNYAVVLDVLRERIGLEAFTVVGHSLGADVALTYAGSYPERVRTLALLHPVTAGTGPTAWLGRAYYRIGALLPPAAAHVWLLSRPAIWAVDGLMVESRDPGVRQRIRELDYLTAELARPRAISEAYLSLGRTPFHALAARVSAPTLVVTGDRDQLARPAAVAELARRFPRARLVVVAGAGHLWPAEHPRAAADLVAPVLTSGWRPGHDQGVDTMYSTRPFPPEDR